MLAASTSEDSSTIKYSASALSSRRNRCVQSLMDNADLGPK